MRPALPLIVALTAALALSAAAPAASGTKLRIDSDKTALKFVRSSATAKAGKITLVMFNPSVLPHNIAVKGGGLDVKGKIVGKGGTSTVSVTLKAGKYTFYCSVPGHEAAGMKGTLTVK